MGQGDGHGEDTATNVAAGSGVAVCFIVCFFFIGVPAIITGGVLIGIASSGYVFKIVLYLCRYT